MSAFIAAREIGRKMSQTKGLYVGGSDTWVMEEVLRQTFETTGHVQTNMEHTYVK